MNRRQFISASAAAMAAPLILPSRLFGKSAPSNQLQLAAIGCGGRGTYNVLNQFVHDLPEVRIVAACDCFKHKREAFANQVNAAYGNKVCETFADHREVLARPDIDGVIISTHDHWHVPLAYEAIRAGKDLYVEKPLSLSMEWSKKLRKLMEAQPRVFQYGTQQRGDLRQFRRACELVRNGYIGDITEVIVWCPDMSQQNSWASKPPYGSLEEVAPPADFDYDRWIGPAFPKPFTVDRCSPPGGYHIYDYALGFIAGWGAHPIDIAQWGLGTDHTSPIFYEGTGQRAPEGSLWDTIWAFDVKCEYANGIKLRLLSEPLAKSIVPSLIKRPPHSDHGTLFLGSKGWIGVDRDALYASDKALQKQEIKDDEFHLPSARTHAQNFVDCIRSRALTLSPLETAIRGDTISHLGDIAIRTGRAIRWDPAAETIIGDDQARKMLDRPIRDAWNPFSS